MPSRKNRKSPKNRKSRKSGGGFGYEPGAYPFQAGMGAASTQSLLQGAGFNAAHAKQHGGASAYMAPGGLMPLPGAAQGTGAAPGTGSTGMPSMPAPGTGMPAPGTGSTGMPSMPAPGTGMPSASKGGRRKNRKSSRQNGGVAPLSDPTMLLDGAARGNAMVAGYDQYFADIAGLKDDYMQGGARRGRKSSRRGRKSSRRGRKSSRRGRKSSRRVRGGALTGAPLSGQGDVSSFYGPASGPAMLLKNYSAAGLNPDWNSVGSYTPKPHNTAF